MASLVKVSFIEFLNKALTEMYYANKVGIPKELLCLFYKMKYNLSYLMCSSSSKWSRRFGVGLMKLQMKFTKKKRTSIFVE